MHGLRERSSAVLDDRREHLLSGKRVICLTLLYRFLRRNARYGQDRTLFWLQDRLIGRLRGSCEGVGKDGHCDRILAGDLLCKASEKLG